MGWFGKRDEQGESQTPRAVRILRWVAGGVAIATIAALILGSLTKWLWNSLMPELFGLAAITYWQAVGLMVLGRLLVGGGPGPDHPHARVHHDRAVRSLHRMPAVPPAPLVPPAAPAAAASEQSHGS